MRLLLLEDDPASQKMLAVAMRRRGHAVDTVGCARQAFDLARNHPYDVLIVDVGLPEGPQAGLDFVTRLRLADVQAPVLFLSARGELEDRVAGLDVGGDDYLVKPCQLPEVEARLRALNRRTRPATTSVVRHVDMEVNLQARHVKRDGVSVHLTAKEYRILELLVAHPGRLFTRDEIISRVWDETFFSDEKLVNVYIKTLRRKLGPCVIETVRGLGYRFQT